MRNDKTFALKSFEFLSKTGCIDIEFVILLIWFRIIAGIFISFVELVGKAVISLLREPCCIHCHSIS